MGRRGVITGTPAQGMVISLPVGLLLFLTLALLTGALQNFARFSVAALASLSAAGVLHFVIGRYCNFRASQAAGVNLTAPVMQLNAVVTLVLAVVVLREPCTMLQVAGAVLMVAGSLVTQRASQRAPASKPHEAPAFRPRIAVGFFFASIAALTYGTSPIIVRQALADADRSVASPAARSPTRQPPPRLRSVSSPHPCAATSCKSAAETPVGSSTPACSSRRADQGEQRDARSARLPWLRWHSSNHFVSFRTTGK